MGPTPHSLPVHRIAFRTWCGSALLPLAFLTACTAHGQTIADPPEHKVIGLEPIDLCEHAPWHLVFADEFNGGTLDADKWVTFFPFCEVADQCWSSRSGFPTSIALDADSNVTLSGDGTLRILTRQGPLATWYDHSSVYTTGVIFSRQKFKRGRFESRIKLPRSTARYLWPAFWLFGGGPRCSEIDILEILKRPTNTFHYALHRYNYECDEILAHDQGNINVKELSEDFHVFRLDWDTWFIDWSIDGELIYRACRVYDTAGRPVSGCNVPGGIYVQNQAFPGQDHELSLIISSGLGSGPLVDALGNGPPIPDLPAVMEVDYVRVYERGP